MYPIDRYQFFSNYDKSGRKKVIAVSSYAGRSVRGVATCSPQDAFDLDTGKELAAARCNVKIAEKRVKRAEEKKDEAFDEYMKARQRYRKMMDYLNDANYDYFEAIDELDNIEQDLY